MQIGCTSVSTLSTVAMLHDVINEFVGGLPPNPKGKVKKLKPPRTAKPAEAALVHGTDRAPVRAAQAGRADAPRAAPSRVGAKWRGRRAA